MPAFSNPSEIARETLKQLTSRRMAPSPDNYQAIYNEIAGIHETPAAAFPERELKSLIAALPGASAAQQRLTRQLEQSLKAENWEDYRKILIDFITEHSTESAQNWGELIGEFLRQWEAKQSNLTPARKREALEHVLAGASKNSEILFARLQSLIKSWSQNSANVDELVMAGDATETLPEAPMPASTIAPVAAPATPSRASELLPELRELFAYTLEVAVITQLGDDPDLAAEARAIVVSVRGATTLQDMQEMLAAIKRLAFRLEFLAEDRNELRAGLIKLLQLMIENVSELVIDDQWLNGQLAMVSEIVARPMNVRAINDAEQHVKEVIFKQSQLKHSLVEAQEALKQMLAGFVDHLAEFADSTSEYHDKIEVCAAKISSAKDINQLEDVLAEVISETRIIQLKNLHPP